MGQSPLLGLYRAMVTARQIDQVERELTNRGEVPFSLSGAGHEGAAAIVPHLIEDDWIHCHYRSRAMLIARGVSPRSFFDNVLSKDSSSSRGRRMCTFFSDPALNLLSMVTLVGNNALQSVGVAASVKDRPNSPIVLCGIGDGTTQQGEFLEACSEAVRSELPALFWIEDNGWAISTQTQGQTVFSYPGASSDQLFGMPVHTIDGANVATAYEQLGPIVAEMRHTRRPAIVVMKMERLASHTNSDDQRVYRDETEIRSATTEADPIANLTSHLKSIGHTEATLEEIRAEVAAEIDAAYTESVAGADPVTTQTAKRPLPVEMTHPAREVPGSEEGERLTMREAIRDVLKHHLNIDDRVRLLGEDIEDPKGDVFGVTRGLSTQFPGRVCNSALTESTIIGTSIGRALAGERPIAFMQFADFLPLAHNQITAELATMHWRTGGQWNAPVIVMVSCGGYRPGLGPYHAQTLESIMAHTPGLDVFMPSTAADAAGMLNAAMASERPTIFFYPKTCLNDPQQTTSVDVERQFVPIGPARKVRSGRDITFVAWGSTVGLCDQAASELEKAGIEAEVLDLRSLSPWDEHAVLASAEKTARLVVVHEDNRTCGMGAEVVATVAEKTRVPVAVRRVTRADTHIPCNFANQVEVLPSFKSVLAMAAELLDLNLSWLAPEQPKDDLFAIETIGSGPSDETVEVVELLVQVGDEIEQGDAVASLEATKAVFELTSPVSGTLMEILAQEGNTIAVGAPLMKLRAEHPSQQTKTVAQQPGKPVLIAKPAGLVVARSKAERRAFEVGISSIAAVTGSRSVSNAQLLRDSSAMTPADILQRTGIESRHWAGENDTPVSMAADACWQLLDQENLILDDLSLVICSTTSPTTVTPSTACQVLSALQGGKSEAMLQAYDINAACSGYLYALQAGYDYLQSTPHGRVMVVTTEVLSPLLDPEDLDTAIIFGDAASATILYGEEHMDRTQGRLHRPDLSAKGENGSVLSVPFHQGGFIHMEGRKVFSEAVRTMLTSLTRVCQRDGLVVNDLDLVVPHQANGRIIDAIQRRLDVSVYSNIRHHGNTSSTSIPLCLKEVLPQAKAGDRLGLCAFGGGFTFGAGILEVV